MSVEDVNVLSSVIAVWGWHIIAWIFLVNAIVLFALKEPIYTSIFGLLFVICEYVALNKKRRIQNANEEE